MKYLFILLTPLIIGCESKGRSVPTQKENALDEFRVTLLFTVDGCKVYRFYDSGRYRWFTKCGPVQWNETHGKIQVEESVE